MSWWSVLGALVLVRLAMPLVALAASGHDLPVLPPYTYAPLNGDAFGYYAAAREAISAAGRLPVLVMLALALAVVLGAACAYRTWKTGRRWLGLLLAGGAGALASAAVVNELEPPGAPVIGWPLLLAIPLAPYRLVAEPSPDVAFAAGLVLSLGAIAATVVATAYIGLHASGRRWLGLLAALLYTAWPLLALAAAGGTAWQNGQWHVEVGLALYTEPVSTALVALALALVLRSPMSLTVAVLAGHLLGLAAAVKLSNALVAVTLAAAVALRGSLRAAVALAAAGTAWIPVVALYWPKGYVEIYGGRTAPGEHAWALGNVDEAWTESLLFTPALSVALAALATAGALALRRPLVVLTLAAPVLATAALYSVYGFTPQHPRFLYVTLPPLLTLVAASLLPLAGRLGGGSGAVRA